MTRTPQTLGKPVESRIASLPIAEVEREEAREWICAGEELGDALLAIIHFFTDHSTPTLRHTH